MEYSLIQTLNTLTNVLNNLGEFMKIILIIFQTEMGNTVTQLP